MTPYRFRPLLPVLLLFTATLLWAGQTTADPEARRHAELRAEIARHDDLYFRAARPEISDAEYDALKRELREIEARHPGLATPQDPAAGDDRTGRFPARAHLVPMLGLEKSYTESELRKFLTKVRRSTGGEPLRWVIEPKYDGLALSLVYEDGRLQRAVTRGNGEEGDDVTANLLECAELPRDLGRTAGQVPQRVEIRGEVYLARAEFDRLNAARMAAGEDVFAHPRNLAVGTLKSLDAAERSGRRLSFVAFGWGAWQPALDAPASQQDGLHRLAGWGFETPEYHVAPGEDTVWGIVRAIESIRLDFPAPLDGVVIKVDETAHRGRLGESRTAPNWAIAHKFEPERVETRLRSITLQVGRTGAITPVAELDPVTIGGVTITRATLHNRAEIERRDYRADDVVRVERAGDVIPRLVGVVLRHRPVGSMPFVFPTACPACATALEPDGESGLRCPLRACPARAKRRIEHFASAGAVNLRGFGPSLVSELVDRGLVRDIDDIYRLGQDALPARLRDEIERSRRAELWRFVAGFGLSGVGPVTARRLAARCRSLDGLLAADAAVLRAAGLSERSAEAVLVELRSEDLRRIVAGLAAAGVQPSVAEQNAGLAGRRFVFTGSFGSFTRAEAEHRVRTAGGEVQSAVGQNTNFLVVGDGGGRKRDEARRLGVPVLSETEFLALLGEAAPD